MSNNFGIPPEVELGLNLIKNQAEINRPYGRKDVRKDVLGRGL